jgi:hypothetical protein
MKRRRAIGALGSLTVNGPLHTAAGRLRTPAEMSWPRAANVLLMVPQARLLGSWVYALAYRGLPEPFQFCGNCGGVQ